MYAFIRIRSATDTAEIRSRGISDNAENRQSIKIPLQKRKKAGETGMWCAVHVGDGEEARMEAFVTGLLPESLNARCFHLTRSRRKKYGGRWQTVREKLLPGYVFIDTDQPEKVYGELKKAGKPKLLSDNETDICTLREQEVILLDRIADKIGEIAVSNIRVNEDGTFEFLSGPILQVKELVRKVDLHKRIAKVEMDFLGKRQFLYLGIEIEP